jgi:hypothetical protein
MVPKAGVTFMTNVAVDLVMSGVSEESGLIANQIGYMVPPMNGHKATNYYGIYFNDTPNSGSIASLTNVDILLAPGAGGKVSTAAPLGLTNYTVATLPSGFPAGVEAYVSDALTPFGVGGEALYDGSNWKVMPWYITAASTTNAYFLNCQLANLDISTPITSAYFSGEQTPSTTANLIGGRIPRVATFAGTASAVGLINGGTYGSYIGYQTGSAVAGAATGRGSYTKTPAALDAFFCGGVYAVSNLCNATDQYWCYLGFESGSSTNIPTTGVYFLYDMFNAAGRASPGAETNHWLAVTARSSSFTYSDTGLTPTLNGSGWDRLAVSWNINNAVFYTNGVAAVTNSTANTIPNGVVYFSRVDIFKSVGARGEVLYEAQPFYHQRVGVARVYP